LTTVPLSEKIRPLLRKCRKEGDMKSKLLLFAIVALVLVSNVNRVGIAQTNWKLPRLADKNLSSEDRRIQEFWRGYYDSLKNFYGSLDHLDWVAYYKNHGFKINVGLNDGSQRTQFAPVFVAPTMQWALPNGKLNGPLASLFGGPLLKTGPEGPKGPTAEASENSTEEKKTVAVAGSAPLEYKAVSFGGDATENTKILNDLAAEGWHYVGRIGDDMVAFRRPRAMK
jgi:hypothetical protein